MAAAASAAGTTHWALASGDKPAFPSKPLRVIVPFAAGGATDVLARAVCDKLGQQLGQPSIVDNRPGAAGLLACDAVAKAAPDGHTLTLGTTSTMLSNQFMFKKLAYDPQKDLVPVVRICWAPIVLVVNSKLAARSLPELMAYAKANKGQLTYGSYGIGSQGHLALATLSKITDADMTHIAYKGEAPMVQDLAGGQLMIGIGSILSLKQHIDSGKLRAIAFTGRTRVPALPDVPTFADLGHQQDAFTLATGRLHAQQHRALPPQHPVPRATAVARRLWRPAAHLSSLYRKRVQSQPHQPGHGADQERRFQGRACHCAALPLDRRRPQGGGRQPAHHPHHRSPARAGQIPARGVEARRAIPKR